MYKSFKFFRKSLLRLIITLTLIVLISFIPSIYTYEYKYYRVSEVNIDASQYPESIGAYFKQLSKGDLGSYTKNSNARGRMGEKNNIPEIELTDSIWYYLKNTILIFFPGLLSGLIFGVLFAFLTLLFKQKWKKITDFFSFFLIAIPDFFVIIMLQFLVIYIYKKTGWRPFAVATGGSSKAIFLPIFTLSIFPFAYIYRVMVNSFDNTLSNQYIQTAYAKGLNKFKVVYRHVIKNSLIITLKNIPSIILPAISNLFIVEYLFNTHGITDLVFSNPEYLNILVASVFLIWIMVELILLVNDLLLRLLTKHKEDSYV